MCDKSKRTHFDLPKVRIPPPCTAVSYLFTYLLPDGYPISYPVGYPGNELPDNGSPTRSYRHAALIGIDDVIITMTSR